MDEDITMALTFMNFYYTISRDDKRNFARTMTMDARLNCDCWFQSVCVCAHYCNVSFIHSLSPLLISLEWQRGH